MDEYRFQPSGKYEFSTEEKVALARASLAHIADTQDIDVVSLGRESAADVVVQTGVTFPDDPEVIGFVSHVQNYLKHA